MYEPHLVFRCCSGCASKDLEHAALAGAVFESDSNTSKGPRHSLLTDLENATNSECDKELEELVTLLPVARGKKDESAKEGTITEQKAGKMHKHGTEVGRQVGVDTPILARPLPWRDVR